MADTIALLRRLLDEHFPVALDRTPKRLQRRVIYDREGGRPYLARFYVSAPPTMPDGSEPFEVDGSPRPGIQWRHTRSGIGCFVHYFYRGDDDGALHNHPWRWAVSLVLAGGYREERRTRDNRVLRRTVHPGTLNLIRHDTFHRVDLLDPQRGAWTLFVTGPKVTGWGFWDRDTGEFLPWRQFIARKRGWRDNEVRP